MSMPLHFFERVAPDSATSQFTPLVSITTSQFTTFVAIATSQFTPVFVLMLDNFFAVRIIPVKNYLSSTVVEVKSISCFKARLSREGQTKFVNIRLYFYIIFSIDVFTVVFMLFKLYFIRVTASASLDPEVSLSVLSHNTLHLSYNDTAYMRLEKFLNK